MPDEAPASRIPDEARARAVRRHILIDERFPWLPTPEACERALRASDDMDAANGIGRVRREPTRDMIVAGARAAGFLAASEERRMVEAWRAMWDVARAELG